jgi:hypothetical protein
MPAPAGKTEIWFLKDPTTGRIIGGTVCGGQVLNSFNLYKIYYIYIYNLHDF